jgi:predicted nucleic acid-binding protein
MRVALDTNVLVYAEGFGDDVRCQSAGELIAQFKPTDLIVAVQVLGELSRVLTSKMKKSGSEVRDLLLWLWQIQHGPHFNRQWICL